MPLTDSCNVLEVVVPHQLLDACRQLQVDQKTTVQGWSHDTDHQSDMTISLKKMDKHFHIIFQGSPKSLTRGLKNHWKCDVRSVAPPAGNGDNQLPRGPQDDVDSIEGPAILRLLNLRRKADVRLNPEQHVRSEITSVVCSPCLLPTRQSTRKRKCSWRVEQSSEYQGLTKKSRDKKSGTAIHTSSSPVPAKKRNEPISDNEVSRKKNNIKCSKILPEAENTRTGNKDGDLTLVTAVDRSNDEVNYGRLKGAEFVKYHKVNFGRKQGRFRLKFILTNGKVCNKFFTIKAGSDREKTIKEIQNFIDTEAYSWLKARYLPLETAAGTDKFDHDPSNTVSSPSKPRTKVTSEFMKDTEEADQSSRAEPGVLRTRGRVKNIPRQTWNKSKTKQLMQVRWSLRRGRGRDRALLGTVDDRGSNGAITECEEDDGISSSPSQGEQAVHNHTEENVALADCSSTEFGKKAMAEKSGMDRNELTREIESPAECSNSAVNFDQLKNVTFVRNHSTSFQAKHSRFRLKCTLTNGKECNRFFKVAGKNSREQTVMQMQHFIDTEACGWLKSRYLSSVSSKAAVAKSNQPSTCAKARQRRHSEECNDNFISVPFTDEVRILSCDPCVDERDRSPLSSSETCNADMYIINLPLETTDDTEPDDSNESYAPLASSQVSALVPRGSRSVQCGESGANEMVTILSYVDESVTPSPVSPLREDSTDVYIINVPTETTVETESNATVKMDPQSQSVRYSRRLTNLPYREAIRILCRVDEDKVSFVPPCEPQPGDLYLISTDGEESRLKDWRCDQINWSRNNGTKLYPPLCPKVKKIHHKSKEGTFRRYAWWLLTNPHLVLVHYLGSPAPHGSEPPMSGK